MVDFGKLKISPFYTHIDKNFLIIGKGVISNSHVYGIKGEFTPTENFKLHAGYTKKFLEKVLNIHKELNSHFKYRNTDLNYLYQAIDEVPMDTTDTTLYYSWQRTHKITAQQKYKRFRITGITGYKEESFKGKYYHSLLYGGEFELTEFKKIQLKLSYLHEPRYNTYKWDTRVNFNVFRAGFTGNILAGEETNLAMRVFYSANPFKFLRTNGNYTLKTLMLKSHANEHGIRLRVDLRPIRAISISYAPYWNITKLKTGEDIRYRHGWRGGFNWLMFRWLRTYYIRSWSRAIAYDEFEPKNKLQDNITINEQSGIGFAPTKKISIELREEISKKHGLYRTTIVESLPGETISIYKDENIFKLTPSVTYRLKEYLFIKIFHGYEEYSMVIPDSLPTRVWRNRTGAQLTQSLTEYLKAKVTLSHSYERGCDPFLARGKTWAEWQKLSIEPGFILTVGKFRTDISYLYEQSYGDVHSVKETANLRVRYSTKYLSISLGTRYIRAYEPDYSTLEVNANVVMRM